MSALIAPLARLINELSRLPSIGSRTAQRLAYYILEQDEADVRQLAEAIWQARKQIRICPVCQGLTDQVPCALCTDPRRDGSTICVVSGPRDVEAMERTRAFQGLYHVLHGVISPGRKVGPEDIRVRELLERLKTPGVKEVIVATNPNLEGEATAMYLAGLIRPLGIRVTRIAHGLPVGSDLEYADEVTLGRALTGRRDI